MTSHPERVQLSRRQLQVIELLARGLKNREIAEGLGIATQVVRNYLSRIYAATGATNRVELARWYEARLHEGMLRKGRTHGRE
jgi:DNA-binding NarL/FixJ family response regulator